MTLVPRAVAFVAALLALAACPSKKTDRIEQSIEKTREFTDRMCACKDKACRDRVAEEMTKWSTEMTAKAKADGYSRELNHEQRKQLMEIGQVFGECTARTMSASGGPAVVEPPPITKGDPVPSVTPSPHLPPPLYGTLWADRLLSDARTWARAQRTGRVLASATFAFIDRHGALDPADGEVSLRFGRVDETESKRRLGGKVKPKQTRDDCFTLSTITGAWSETQTECVDATSVPLRCSVAQIWQRALEKKAPAEALATVSFAATPAPTWTFAIDDEPRNVHIRHSFPDDCPLAVEK